MVALKWSWPGHEDRGMDGCSLVIGAGERKALKAKERKSSVSDREALECLPGCEVDEML